MRPVALLLAALTLSLGGCGAVDRAVEDAKRETRKRVEQIKEKAAELEREAERIRARLQERVNEVLADLRGVVPQADAQTVVPQRVAANSFQGFLEDVFDNVDGFWQRTFKAAGIGRPRVSHRWVSPGTKVRTGCNDNADDQAAFYCPADDTIYIGEAIGRDILTNLGDFGVAYVVAHEYAHNVQQELGWYSQGLRFTTVAPFELQADCMAGAWGYAVYQEGLLDATDVEEAVSTAYAVGDFDLTNPQHHGTPDERAGAWTRGYRTGDPSRCVRFLRN